MNLSETLALLDKLNTVGAKHFKSIDFEVSMGGKANPVVREVAQTTTAPSEEAKDPEVPYSAENTRRAENLIDLLNSKDEELFNKICPAGA